VSRRLPIGAELQPSGGTHFRVWAPAATSVAVVLDGRSISLDASAAGYFEGLVADAVAGSLYRLQLDDEKDYADPASRFQPDGPHGPSEVIDPAFAWTDQRWPGVTEDRPIVYELHVGTFTAEGTFAAAAKMLPELASLGVSLIEILPLAEFPGRFGWGYDGVLPFAPTRLYGRPDDLRRFVNDAHALGIGVILDVVYNHFGPDGCPLRAFAPAYFSTTATEWGDSYNLDGPCSGPVREYVLANARYWIEEFHLDGLRLDATQSIHDKTSPHIIAEITQVVRQVAGARRTWIVGENEPQDARLLRSSFSSDAGVDALWNDDFHHSAMVALTGRREAYYTDYAGSPQEFVSAAKHGFLYQGQWYSWQKQPRGTAARAFGPAAFVAFLQNHDQVANSLDGKRLHQLASAGRYRAMTALLLLGPWTPMLFQGQEFAASSPFFYFADHHPELARAVRDGRREFLAQFPSLKGDAVRLVPDPDDEQTFLRSKIDQNERHLHEPALALHRSLIALRRADPAFHDIEPFGVDGAVLGPATFMLRFGTRRADVAHLHQDRVLIVNLGGEITMPIVPEPLLSPYPSREWSVIWSSEDPAYGGLGIPDRVIEDRWHLPGESALVLAPQE
jgi:maltooligosyltrehalose trehalohydrolase